MTQTEACAAIARSQHKDKFQVLIGAAADKGIPERDRYHWAVLHDALADAILDPQDDLEALEIACAADYVFADSLSGYWADPIVAHCDRYIATRLVAGDDIDSTVVKLRNALRHFLRVEKAHVAPVVSQGAM